MSRRNEVILEGERLTKYFGGSPALRDVSFRAEKGEILGLIGPNGAGKTTLLNVISGILKPSAGRVLFQGRDVTGTRPHAIARLGVARVLQTPRPFLSMTVLENVAVGALFGGRDRMPEASAAAEQAEFILQFMGLHGKPAEIEAKSPVSQRLCGVRTPIRRGQDIKSSFCETGA